MGSDSLYDDFKTAIHAAGDGLKAQLPGDERAGFIAEGCLAPRHPNLLLVTDRSASAERLAQNLTSIRRDQADN